VPHPIITRTWFWRAETEAVIEALGFAGGPLSQAGRDWLAELGPVQEDTIGPAPDSPVLGWAGTRPFNPAEADRLCQAARFVAAPLAALTARAALVALLETYVGRRSAARVQAGAVRRGTAVACLSAWVSDVLIRV
jgi:adenylate cyclase